MRAIYVSYDGALDPLGGSQVVPYVIGLAGMGHDMTLVTFEKPARWSDAAARSAMERGLAEARVRWKPLRYHQTPRLPATAWDLCAASRAIGTSAHGGPLIVHCRGEVAMTAARRARLPSQARLLYDVRGLFADERVEAGSWRGGGLLDRLVRRAEAANLHRADGVVVLTEPALRVLAQRRAPLPPHAIIPTSVDLDRFSPPLSSAVRDYGLVYSGSLGTWYMTDEMVEFSRLAAQALNARSLFLTPQAEAVRASKVPTTWADVASVSHADVPAWLRRCRAMVFFIRPTPAKQASCPTKLAEALATGLPVVMNRGIGGLESLIEAHGVGVVLDELRPEAYAPALQRLEELLGDAGTVGRCRALAEQTFDLTQAVRAYHRLYDRLAGGWNDDPRP